MLYLGGSSGDTYPMKSRVFLSCGQRPNEKGIAAKLRKMIEDRGFDVYVAIDAQTILEINTGIIGELKGSDCYLFVNFRRDEIRANEFRGSLFSNQELAIAFALGFQRLLVVNQEGIIPEGMLRYIGVNTETFSDLENCCATVERAIERAAWTNNYSRRLSAGQLRFSDELIQFGTLVGKFLYLDVLNGRPDIAALETTARLTEFGTEGQPLQPCPIRSPLKATARPGFSHTIFPESYEAFDLLCVGSYNPAGTGFVPLAASGYFVAPFGGQRSVLLNTALDVAAAPRLPIGLGEWHLRYEFYAIGFPVLSVSVGLTLKDWDEPSARVLNQKTV